MPKQEPETARDAITNYLLEQILGPTEFSLYTGLAMPEVDSTGKIRITREQAEQSFHDPETGFPVLMNTRPKMVFGTGVLHPPFQREDSDEEEISESQDNIYADDQPDLVPNVPIPNYGLNDDPSEESSSIDQSQKLRPSAMGLTAQLVISERGIIKIAITGATYEPKSVIVEDTRNSIWYIRKAHKSEITINWSDLEGQPNHLKKFDLPGKIGQIAELQLRWRRSTSLDIDGNPLVALTAVVAHKGGAVTDELFQFEMRINLEGGARFAAVDKTNSLARADSEEQEIEFLYRHVNNYASGHGVSVHWDEVPGKDLVEISTRSVPIFFQEQIDTHVEGMSYKMLDLATWGLDKTRIELQGLIDGYEGWIEEAEKYHLNLQPHQAAIGERLTGKARYIVKRMQHGLDTLTSGSESNIHRAFQIANHAMYLQQQRGKIAKREFIDGPDGRIAFPELEMPDEDAYGTWRPFQVAFLLLVLPGLIDPMDEFRDEVDLIFFPTGGGKTEAYLGAAAMLIAFRRLTDPHHKGVDVLMRYTLRLLTVQQFERSSGLIVALEFLRRKSPELLGEHPISIGVWLGSKTTPNKRSQAVEALKSSGDKDEAAHPFILNQCPWCGAEFGVRKIKAGKQTKSIWVGYKKSTEGATTLRFICEDTSCDFSRESKALPIWITDEDVYDFKPAFVLGTVDKFAELAWQKESRALFNIDKSGSRIGLPPGLIIQDELHLISGPLGSMVGLYETIIDELCSFEHAGKKVRAKIVASTATTRRYESQICNLYARDRVTLFPQAVTRANETYFSRVSKIDGVARKGTQYLGINPATYATGQLASSQVCAFLSQAPEAWNGPKDEMDFYSTSVWFFNSLKELGQTLTLMQSTVVSLLSSMWRDRRIPRHKTRYLDPILELTGRVSSSEVRESLDKLKKTSDKKGYVRTCLASSIMEVGVDVPRLGLLTINSQPKLTAQYIQVSGRVGRNPDKGPGMVVMLYNSSRARDRSVYEQFGNYHKRLYSQVEPLSVTPFAIQTMEKALLGAFIALYRMYSPTDATPTTIDEERFEKTAGVFRDRINALDSSNARIEDFEQKIRQFKANWARYKPIQWQYEPSQEHGRSDNQATALLRRRAEVLDHIAGDDSLTIPQSMRTVDGQTDIQPSSNVYNFLPSEADK